MIYLGTMYIFTILPTSVMCLGRERRVQPTLYLVKKVYGRYYDMNLELPQCGIGDFKLAKSTFRH